MLLKYQWGMARWGFPKKVIVSVVVAMLALGVDAARPAEAQLGQHPLEPPATSSPRETIHTFLTSADEMWALVRDEGAGRRSDQGFQKLLELDTRAKRTLDLSEIAPEARTATADDVSVYLYEVLSRIELPPLDEVPGDEGIGDDFELDYWSIPHTEITIHRITEGPRQGEFLFSPETVERAEEFYERTKTLPYRRQPPIEHVSEFLEVYGGWNVPLAWIDALPAAMRTVAWGQALWKWVILIAAVFSLLVLIFLASRFSRRKVRPRSAAGHLRSLAIPVLLFVGSAFAIPRLAYEILLVGRVAKFVNLTATALAYLSLAWVIWILIIAAGEALVRRPRFRAESLDASLIRLSARLMAIAVALVLILQGATAIGLPLVGLVAGVSVGGLAVALAAQDTLKNVLGSLMIFIDQPYRVGERIVAANHDGVVEQIGLRSTRIRQLDGHVTSIPNERMAAIDVENVERRQYIRRKTKLRIATGTPREKVQRALEVVRDILKDHEGMPEEQPPRVHFEEFNPDSLSIVMFYWYEPPDYWAYCEFSERINLEILRRFAEAGIELAPPTSAMRLTDASGELLELGPTETAD